MIFWGVNKMLDKTKFADAITILMECKSRPMSQGILKAWYSVIGHYEAELFEDAVKDVISDSDVVFPNINHIMDAYEFMIKQRQRIKLVNSRQLVSEAIKKHLSGEPQDLFLQFFKDEDEYRKILNDDDPYPRYKMGMIFEQMNDVVKSEQKKSLIGENNEQKNIE